MSRTMNQGTIPARVDPIKCVEQNTHIEGVLAVSKLDRLGDYLTERSGEVQVSMTFGRDEQKIATLQGQCDTRVKMLCQRCLKPVEVEVSSEFSLGIVFSDEQASHLPKQYDPIVTDGESLALPQLLEDELILSLPMFAYHDHCEEHEHTSESVSSQDEAVVEKKENPFSVLAQLKKS
ncbi:MAG: DUF177 domain-containing protein [Oceanospirillaceae bacterium]|nr:DUF177 domain-containing protein [Oceanospirillaceae bacterium]MCP5349423.1 DUF177 domain-containing protein [Oceanospirillaceae bacterium]